MRDPVRLVVVMAGTGVSVLLCFFMCSRSLLEPISNRFPQMMMILPTKVRRFASDSI
jgi:hypothetical protein